jgi:hypothetical protein
MSAKATPEELEYLISKAKNSLSCLKERKCSEQTSEKKSSKKHVSFFNLSNEDLDSNTTEKPVSHNGNASFDMNT